MKKIIALFLLFSACQSNTANPPPVGLIPQDTMEDILYDITLLKTIKNNRFGGEAPLEILNNNYILRKYQLTDSVLKRNQIYYAQSPKKMVAMYDRILKRLEKAEDSIGVLVQQEQAALEERLQREKDSIAALKVRDSIKLLKSKDSLQLLKVHDSLLLLKRKDSLVGLKSKDSLTLLMEKKLGKLEATFEN